MKPERYYTNLSKCTDIVLPCGRLWSLCLILASTSISLDGKSTVYQEKTYINK